MYKLNEEKMFFDVAENQAIVIDFTSGVYYGTSTLGSVVLERLVNGNAPEAVLQAVQMLDGCPENIDKEFAAFVAQLKEAEILIPGETTEGGDAPIAKEALADGFALTVDAFTEVQDLILADPVHDVDVKQGWPVLKED